MSEAVLIALISAGLPTLVTIIANVLATVFRGRASARHSAKQSILQMIMEDHLAVSEGRLPTNYQNVVHEYDVYHSKGGDTYITDKVQEYKMWFIALEGGKK